MTDKKEPKPFLNTGDIIIKKGFEERYRCLCGSASDYDEFMKYSLSYLRRSIRVNTLKADVKNIKKRLEAKGWTLTQIPWCHEGFWLESERRDVGNLDEHSLGYIYVQEAASMIPPIVLDPKPGELILDMCAAPGSKTTQIAAMMQNRGILIANDYKGGRVSPLGYNLQRIGATNVIVTLMEGRFFTKMQFDKILVDAPCSGTGTIRKSIKTLTIWNPGMTKSLSGTQKQLLKTAFDSLKDGGTIVYSTCTLEPDENEGVISWLLKNNPNAKTEKINLPLKHGKPVTEFEGETYHEGVKNCLRIWPQDNDTEGFFITKIIKKNPENS